MHFWTDGGTDIATIGAWDADLPRVEKYIKDKQMRREAAEGKVFLVFTGADGGGRIDVFVDEPISIPCGPALGNAANLLHLPSGRLLIGGAEDYRASKPMITSDQDVKLIDAGLYAIRCYEPPEMSEEEMAAAAGITAEESQVLAKTERRMSIVPTLGCPLMLALTFVPIYWRWWYGLIGLAAGLVIFFGLEAIFRALFYGKHAKEIYTRYWEYRETIPTLIFHLERVETAGDLKGGSVTLDSDRRLVQES